MSTRSQGILLIPATASVAARTASISLSLYPPPNMIALGNTAQLPVPNLLLGSLGTSPLSKSGISWVLASLRVK